MPLQLPMTAKIAFMNNNNPHKLSVVIPLYRGEHTLRRTVEEIRAFYDPTITPENRTFQVVEVILVDDCSIDGTSEVLNLLSNDDSHIVPIWLTRNFGQHAATIAGMASSTSEWVVTMDEDGQHDPNDIGKLIDTAINAQSPVVYARSVVREPHGIVRKASGYNYRTLGSHFLRLVISSGTRPLRVVTLSGISAFVFGLIGVLFVVQGKIVHGYEFKGWASLTSIVLLLGGLVLLSLGIIAEYIGLLVRRALGAPLYVVGSNPLTCPLKRI